jgi:hypothetical protein
MGDRGWALNFWGDHLNQQKSSQINILILEDYTRPLHRFIEFERV